MSIFGVQYKYILVPLMRLKGDYYENKNFGDFTCIGNGVFLVVLLLLLSVC